MIKDDLIRLCHIDPDDIEMAYTAVDYQEAAEESLKTVGVVVDYADPEYSALIVSMVKSYIDGAEAGSLTSYFIAKARGLALKQEVANAES